MMSVWAPNNRPCVPAIVPKSQAAAVRKQLMGSNTRGKFRKTMKHYKSKTGVAP